MSSLRTMRKGHRPLLMDGAMGTELQRAGLGDGACYELRNLTHPEQVRAIHEAYVQAGAECLLTNTFQSNPPALDRHGLRDRLTEINRAAVTLARSACGPTGWVIADVGPIGDPAAGTELAPESVVGEAVQGFEEADALLLETASSPRVLEVAEQGKNWSAVRHLPLLVSLTYRRHPDGSLQTASGHEPEWFARRAAAAGLAALGVNCGRDIGMKEIIEIVRRYRTCTDLPLFARPNAGAPTRADAHWRYPQAPQEMASHVPALVAAGALMVGGCCGTTPAHIAAFHSHFVLSGSRFRPGGQPPSLPSQ
jgi:5-methyltetrahydrofolate--homocysteine methyltransferase